MNFDLVRINLQNPVELCNRLHQMVMREEFAVVKRLLHHGFSLRLAQIRGGRSG
jgi:hypothetical protein